MSHIQRIQIKNFKAIEQLDADFKGCTAIITGGNNKGKSSFLRGIPDRIRFVRPDAIVRMGAENGKGELVLTTGERFVWEYDVEGKDKLTYITSEGVKQTVTKALSARFFPPVFDIDKFLQSSPKEQSKQLQKIIGIDFSDIDSRYQVAYDDRTEKNRDAERYHAKLVEMLEVPFAEAVDTTKLLEKKDAERKRLNDLYLENKKANEATRKEWTDTKEAQRKEWENAKELIRKEVQDFNEANTNAAIAYNACYDAVYVLKTNGADAEYLDRFLASKKAQVKVDKVASELFPPEPVYAPEPEYIEEMPDNSILQAIDDEILAAGVTNQKAQEYKNYMDYKKSVEAAKELAFEADQLVKNIERERESMIQSAKFPQGIAITPAGITVDGFVLDRNQISTSKLYTAALRIAAMNLGEVKTLHFDASFLDKNSLADIQKWADSEGLQLLIERPDYNGGDISYEIVETI